MMMPNQYCPCGQNKKYEACCEPLHKGILKASSAEILMRSRYAAYATHNIDYLMDTTHISQRKYYAKNEILNWATSNKWNKLEVIHATENTVEFKAFYTDNNGISHIHHEFSNFIFENDRWFYLDGFITE
jgi:SEC-C motif-containing protein